MKPKEIAFLQCSRTIQLINLTKNQLILRSLTFLTNDYRSVDEIGTMETKEMVDIRNKRLNYYNKFLSQQFEISSSKNINNTTQNHLHIPSQNTIKNDLISEEIKSFKNSYSNSSQINTVNLLNKFFDETKPIKTGNNVNKLRHFSSSISIDESSASQASTSRQSSNQRLEEFKRVVDASYSQHVINKKLENLTIQSSRRPSPPCLKKQTSLEQETRGENTKYHQIKPQTARSLVESSRPDNQLNESEKHDETLTNKKSSYEIPYMSAYNVYKCKKSKVSEVKSNKNSIAVGQSNLNETDREQVGGKRETTIQNVSFFDPTMSENNILIEKYLSSLQGDSIHEIKKLQSGVNDIKLTLVDKISSMPQDNLNTTHYNTNNGNSHKKHLSSTGSSINASPTSQSSLESPNINHKKQINGIFLQKTNYHTGMLPTTQDATAAKAFTSVHEAKPPETPRTRSAASNYRKHLLLNHSKSAGLIQTPIISSDAAVVDVTKATEGEQTYRTDDIKNFIQKRTDKSAFNNNGNNNDVGKPLEPSLKPTNIVLDHFFNPSNDLTFIKPSPVAVPLSKTFSKKSTKNKIKSKPSVFNIMDEAELDKSWKLADDNSDDDDTFDIFSSQESLNEVDKCKITKAKTSFLPPFSGLDLKIDLGGLSEDETQMGKTKQQSYIQKQQELCKSNEYEEDSIIPISNFKAQSSRVERKQQVKPEIIPMLDLMDDDKSQSVAASLAISMCKEIDYQKEMKVIYELQKKQQQQQHLPETPKSSHRQMQKSKLMSQIKLNKLRTSMPSSMSTSSNASTRLNSNNKSPRMLTQNQPQSLSTTTSNNNFLSISNATKSNSNLSTYNTMNSKILTKQFSELEPRKTPSFDISNDSMLFSCDLPKPETIIRPSSVASLSISKKDRSDKSFVRPYNNQKINSTGSANISIRKSSQFSMSNPKLKSTHPIKNTQCSDSTLMNCPRPNENPESTKNPGLFFSFSKLVALENEDLQNPPKPQQVKHKDAEIVIVKQLSRRPRTAYAKLEISRVNINDFDNIKSKSRPAKPIVERQNSQPIDQNLQSYGDQTAYKEIFPEQLKSETQSISESTIYLSKEPNWLCLPDEIWLNILSLLNKQCDLSHFGATCKHFNKLYADSSLWKKISMKYQYNMCDDWLNWIGKRRPRELNIVQCSGTITLTAIANMFKNIGDELKVLNLSRCSNSSLSGDNFALQASIRCPNVTSLDLSWTLLSNQTLKLISQSFEKIESINLSGCNMIQEDGFNELLMQHGNRLKVLEISGCLHFSSMTIFNIGTYSRNLVRLNISNCHRLTNESIMEASQQLIKLKFLDLRGIKNIKNSCVSQLIRKCPNLEGLALGECVQLGDTTVLEISTHKQNVKHLDLNGCKKITDGSLRSIANFCSNLEYLNLKATNVTDSGLLSLANGKCSKTIKELNLSYLPVSEATVLKIIKNISSLKNLQLYGCYNIKNLDEIKLMQIDSNKNLLMNF